LNPRPTKREDVKVSKKKPQKLIPPQKRRGSTIFAFPEVKVKEQRLF
jgi:hypothetical protein